jgi:hypothetical protein
LFVFFHFSFIISSQKQIILKSLHNLRQESVPWRSKYTHRS